VTTPSIAERTSALGRQIYELERDRSTRAQISDEFPDLSGADAYAVQEEYAKLRIADGAKLVGRKIGLTSRAMQEMFGIGDPDYGHLFDDMAIAHGGDVRTDELIQPMVEIEVAFVLGRDLAGPGVTRDDVIAATASVAPSIEIIDSRITDWAIGFVDTVADNGSSARYVIGDGRIDPRTIDVPSVVGEMWRNGELVSSAPASAVLDGHPADGVAWLANAIGAYGRTLHAGDVVLSGALMRAVPATTGDVFEARFPELGTASCRFA
jgi:2-oxopent-4-enoate hydratase